MTNKLFNFSRTDGFRFSCAEIPIVSELAQDVTIPSVNIGQAQTTSRFVDYNQPGEKIVYAELDVGFIMDENYDAYAEIYSWMQRIAGPPDNMPIEESQRKTLFADASIELLDNTGKMIRKMVFLDAWPVSLGAIAMDTQSSTEIKSILTLDYTAMIIVPHTKNLSGIADMRYTH